MTPTPNGPRAVRGFAVRDFASPLPWNTFTLRREKVAKADTPVLVLPDTDADRERRVEAVAKVLHADYASEHACWSWEEQHDYERNLWMELARAALAAMTGEGEP